MARDIPFPADLLDWATAGDYKYTPAYHYDPDSPTNTRITRLERGRPQFWADGGEVIYFIEARPDGWFQVSRSDRLGDDFPEVAVCSQPLLERYLYALLGESVRDRLRLPDVQVPIEPAQVTGAYRVAGASHGDLSGWGLFDPAGQLLAIAGTAFRASKLSAQISGSVADIKASYRSPDGKPLFSLMPPPPPPPRKPPPAGMSREVADALIDLIRRDVYVNGELDDVLAHRRASPPYPPIRRLPEFYGYVFFFYVGDGYTKNAGFRYIALQPPIPLQVTDDTREQILAILADQRDTLAPEQQWNAALISYKQGADDGMVALFHGDAAEDWLMTPANAERIAAEAKTYVNQILTRTRQQ